MFFSFVKKRSCLSNQGSFESDAAEKNIVRFEFRFGFDDEINSRNVFLFVNFLKTLFQFKFGEYLPRKVMRQLIHYTSLACLMYKINSKTIIQVH